MALSVSCVVLFSWIHGSVLYGAFHVRMGLCCGSVLLVYFHTYSLFYSIFIHTVCSIPFSYIHEHVPWVCFVGLFFLYAYMGLCWHALLGVSAQKWPACKSLVQGLFHICTGLSCSVFFIHICLHRSVLLFHFCIGLSFWSLLIHIWVCVDMFCLVCSRENGLHASL